MKNFILLPAVLALALSLAGCGQNTGTESAASAAPSPSGKMETKKIMGVTLYQSYTTPKSVRVWSADPEEKWEEYITDAIDAAQITNEMSDYDKCAAINDYICSVVSYQNSAEVNLTQTAYNKSILSDYCLVLGKGNCEGYADAFQSLCIACGIECYKATGFMYDQGHCWNRVLIDDTEYWVDVTWNDEYENAYFMSTTLWENHDFLY